MLSLIGTRSAGAQVVLNPIEKITFKFKNPPKQAVTRFEVGEFSGFADAATFKRDGLGPKAFNRADFQVSVPGFSAPVIAHCEGGDSKLGLTWITWMRQDLTYNCSFSGRAPADAALTLALASSSEQQRPPLRAGELRWNGMSIRFDTNRQVPIRSAAASHWAMCLAATMRKLAALIWAAAWRHPVSSCHPRVPLTEMR